MMKIENGAIIAVFFFYDSDSMEVKDVLESLSGGYIYCEEYVPGELDNKYNEKKGVNIKKGKSYEMYIHPDL